MPEDGEELLLQVQEQEGVSVSPEEMESGKNDAVSHHEATMRTARSPFLQRMAGTAGKLPSESALDTKNSMDECIDQFQNEDAKKYYRDHNCTPFRRLFFMLLDTFAAIAIYAANTITVETVLLVINAIGASYFYCINSKLYSAKLDFSFLAFSVVFPLTFVINSVMGYRNDAIHRFADFKSVVENSALMTFSIDWPGRGDNLPAKFNEEALQDFKELLVNVYQYLSMPITNQNRNAVPWFIAKSTKHIHELQLNTRYRINEILLDLSMHTEVMRRAGFPDGIASRLEQYHQYMRQRFEHMRVIKTYGTPQLTRAFGVIYIIVLPWMIGPYFAWVYEETHKDSAFALALAGFTFLILMGLLNLANSLQDPFTAEPTGINRWIPGIDIVRLDREFAGTLHTVEHYFHAAAKYEGKDGKKNGHCSAFRK